MKISFIFFISALIILVSCKNPKTKVEQSPFEETCKTALMDLYNSNYNGVLDKMDDLFIRAAAGISIDSTLLPVTKNMRMEYGPPINLTFISSEKTIYENLRSTFLIFKIESSNKFGYYFFYVNDMSKKLLRISEFVSAKPKG